MLKLWGIPFWLLFPVILLGQNAVYDSIEQVLLAVPVSQKEAYFRDARRRIQRISDPEQQDLRAYLLRNAAREIGDSVSLKYAYRLLTGLYRERGDRKQAADFRREGREVAGQFGWDVEEGYRQRSDFYGYSFSRLHEELMILEGDPPAVPVDSLSGASLNSLFEYNETGESGWDPGSVHWVKLKLHNSSLSDRSVLLAPGHGYTSDHYLLSWDTVEVFIRYEDGTVEELITGSALSPREKDLRDAFNLARVSLSPGETATLYLRLAGAQGEAGQEGIFLEFIDPGTLHELEGFRPDIESLSKSEADGATTPYQVVWRSLEIVEDETGELSFIDVKNDWSFISRFQGPGPVSWDRIFWVRLKLLGNGENTETLLFELPPDRDWAYIDVYWPEDRPGYYAQRQLGQRLPIARRFLPHWRSLIQYDIGAADTVDLYLRLEGYLGDRSAGRIELHRLDQTAFWPRMPGQSLFDGLVMGALLIGIFYFLLRSWLAWDRGQLYYALFLLGIFLTYAFWLPWDRGAILFPALRPWYDYFLITGQFLSVFGLFSFASVRLNIPAFFPKARFLIPGFLVIWFLVNLLRGLLYGGLLPPALFGWLATAYWVILGIGMALLTTLSWMIAGKGHTPAYFFLIALFLVFICSVLLAAYWFAEQGWPAGQPVVYILEAGIAFAVLFLALGAGFSEVGSRK